MWAGHCGPLQITPQASFGLGCHWGGVAIPLACTTVANEGGYDEQAVVSLLALRDTSRTRRSPFRPGRGTLPPYLAGRLAERALIREQLEILAERDAPSSDIVLYGPRGNGKTALLLWARREAEGLGVDVLRFSGAETPSLETLARLTSTMPPWLRWLGTVSLGRVGSVQLKDRTWRQERAILARRARKRPTLLAVDEAHMLGAEAGRVLLNAVQHLQGDGLPVMLILAGTPDLPRHLGTIGASFWDRCEQLPIGRLQENSSADAVRIPLAEHGRSIVDEALEEIVTDSYGYPYFLQIWGHTLWAGCADPSQPLSRADVERSRPAVDRRRRVYYDRRYQELVEADLVHVAVGVAALFNASEKVRADQVYPAIQSSLQREGLASDYGAVMEAARHLRDLGYIWQASGQQADYIEPGIPSLMRHVESKPDLGIRR